MTTRTRRTIRCGATALGVALMLGSLGCTERGAAREMHRAFKKGDYGEVIVIGRHTLRSDSTNARVLLYYGMALAAQDRLHEAFDAIDRAVKISPDAARPAADFLWESAHAGASDVTAVRKLAKAAELDTGRDLGKRRFAVADLYFSERRYDDAARMYEEAIRLFPDTTACENALARLAESYAFTDRAADARRTMETLVERYPRGEHAREAWVRLDDITYGEAQKALDRGDLQKAAEFAEQLVGRTQNRLLQQKGRFVLGEAYERMGEPGRAYAAYREIIESGVHATLSDDAGRVLWVGEATRHSADEFDMDDAARVEQGVYQFARPALPGSGWGKLVEPVFVTGIIVGLIYLFFSNQSDN